MQTFVVVHSTICASSKQTCTSPDHQHTVALRSHTAKNYTVNIHDSTTISTLWRILKYYESV